MPLSESQACAFCGVAFTESEKDDPESTYREVTSWVHGPKLQSPVLRTQTGRLAHMVCVAKILNGQSPDQDSLPGLEKQ